jgi:hypothetical protein
LFMGRCAAHHVSIATRLKHWLAWRRRGKLN